MNKRAGQNASSGADSQGVPVKRTPPYCAAWVDVDLDALVSNYRTVSRHVAPARLIAVIKAYGLGTGAVMLARVLEEAGVFMVATSHFHEAVLLRKEGIRCPVLVMNGLLPEQMELAIKQHISFVASTRRRWSPRMSWARGSADDQRCT